jgi:hypothetical protein
MPKLLLHLLPHLGGELVDTPAGKQMSMQQVLPDGRQLHAERGLQMLQDGWITLHSQFVSEMVRMLGK